MSEIKDVDFVEQQEYNVLQLNDYADCLVGITHEARPRAIYSLSKILEKSKKTKNCGRDSAFKEFEFAKLLSLVELRT